MPATLSTPGRTNEPARIYRSSFVMTSRELMAAAAAKEHFRYSRTTGIVIPIIALPVVFICICGLIILFRMPENEFTPMFLAMYALGLLLALILLFRKPLFVLLNRTRRELRQTIGQEFVIDVSTNGIASPSLGTPNTFPWRAFKNSGCTKKGLILNLEKNLFLWVPANSFASAEDWQTVQELAKAKLPKRQ